MRARFFRGLGLAFLGLSALLIASVAIPTAAMPEAATKARKAAAPLSEAPRPTAASAPLRVAVISDLNGSYGSTRYLDSVHAAVDRLTAVSPDLVLSTGDMVAGQHARADHAAMWESFHGAVSDRLRDAGIPFAVTPGNHDASGYQVFASERALFVEQWEARRPAVQMIDDAHYPLRYTFVAGPAFFVSLDATTVGPLSDEQMRWLDAQLAAAPREVKIVFGHVPLHPFAIGREREHIGDPALETMLNRHGVQLFVSGHHHAYYPGRRGALRLVSTACVGAGPRPLIGTAHRSEKSVVMFEVTADGVRALDAFGGDAYDERIERAALPAFVGVGARRIDRDDLSMEMTLEPRASASPGASIFADGAP